ncbi:hypothetical protein [Anaerovibrio sp.]|nr:hypothetical protein [Anaerovibrio sp.]
MEDFSSKEEKFEQWRYNKIIYYLYLILRFYFKGEVNAYVI